MRAIAYANSKTMPTKAPRYNAAYIDEARTAAVRASAFYSGEPRYVYATYGGFKVVATQPTLPTGTTVMTIRAEYFQNTKCYVVDADVAEVA